jgi:RNA polymerase sigma factor (sigma-70 family)
VHAEDTVAHPVVQILGHGDLAELTQGDRSDGQLLDLFVNKSDQDAFAAVVRRHGPMVLAVCRRILRNPADADDAFQAAFLVLARKANTLATRELLANWLYGVAFNTARKLRQSNLRRTVREKPLPETLEPAVSAQDSQDELIAILDEELSRLPERYRLPIVLCELQGVTRKEAAKLLDCPEGTVAGRLARARELLAHRLTRRGVALPASLLATVLTERITPAASLVSEVMRAVTTGQVASHISDVTERVLNAMFFKKLKFAMVVVLLCGLVFAGVAGVALLTANAQPGLDPQPKRADDKSAPPKLPADPLAKKSDDKVAPTKLATEVNTSTKVLTHIPLKNVEAQDAATKISQLFPKSVTVAAVRDENAIITYASEADTKEILTALKAMKAEVGESTSPQVKKYTLNFDRVSWYDVLDWYSKETGLVNASNVKTLGNVSIQLPQDKKYSLPEITDIINELLSQQKYLLIRRRATFTVVPADEKIDSTLIPRIDISELPQHGKTEVVQVLIPIKSAVDIAPEVQKLLTPFGAIAALRGHLIVNDTAGNIQRIIQTIKEVEEADKPMPKK